MTVPSLTLPSGDRVPRVGLGTWDIDGGTVEESMRAALDAGYTHVDTAEGYMNEAEIGSVLAEHDREDVFLTSTVLPRASPTSRSSRPARPRWIGWGPTTSTCT